MDPNILFEDSSIIVINKPAGMIVHNGKTSVGAWLARQDPALLNHDWPDKLRAGIVHRLDQETSGVLVLAKNPFALENLQNQFKSHLIKKTYLAIVFGCPKPEQGSVNVSLGRHPTRKTPMSVVPVPQTARGTVRQALTEYKVIEKYNEASLIETIIKTGRTHQIRLHLKYIGHPLLGDSIYGTKPSKRLSRNLQITRQMLHAKEIILANPQTGETSRFEALLPEDFSKAIEKLRSTI